MVWRNKIFEEEYKYKDNAIAFFEKLQKILGEKVKGLYIVPGNHDKIRNVMDKSLQKLFQDLFPDTLCDGTIHCL